MKKILLTVPTMAFFALSADAQQICCPGGGGGGSVTYPLAAPNGSSSSPSYSFSSGTGSGMYAPSNGAVTVTGHNAAAAGGAMIVKGGTPTSGDNAGGAVTITGGDVGPGATGATSGGNVTITGGNGRIANANGGSVSISVPTTNGVVQTNMITINGGAQSATTDGLLIHTQGGRITMQPQANPLTSAQPGGDVQILGGVQGGSTSAGGGTVLVKGGPASSGGAGGSVTIAGGSTTEGAGGSIAITASSAVTGSAANRNGGNVNITAGAATGTGTVGEVQINGNGAIMQASFSYKAFDPNDTSFFTATRAVLVKAITCRENAAAGAVAAATILKAPSGTAFSGGTALHTGTFNANSTANTNQILTLSSTVADLNLAAGDSIGVTTTGTWAAGAGSCTVHLQPK